MNIAIISPSKNAYSETFIQAHKNLEGNIFYYYGDKSFLSLEGEGSLHNSPNSFLIKLKRKILRKPFDYYFNELLKRSLRKNSIDVVLAEYGTTAQEQLEVVKDLNLPLIVHFHGFDASRKDILKRYNNYAAVFEYAKYIIVVSKKMHKDILNMGCPQYKLFYNVYGPNNDFLNLTPRYSTPYFISVGRFVDKKAPYYTLLAFKEVVSKFPEAKLKMAGEGYLLNSCKNLVHHFGLKKNVEFLGIITPEEFMGYLENSLAFIQHSLTAENGDSEGTPVAILEASGAGLPVISTFHAGIPDVIDNNKTGFLVPEHDVEEMTNAMLKLLNDPALAKEMGERGKKNISLNYNMKRHLENINKLIQEAVN
jgi:colanic acid/amylovoran biosynthesis glycosyltransferase